MRNLFRSVTIVLLFIMTFSLLMPITYSANDNIHLFSDVSEQHWASKFITKMKLRGVIDGYTDQTFKPNQGINQAQAVSMVVRFLGYEEEAETFRTTELAESNELHTYIEDVPNWARGYVLVAAKLGLISNVSAAGFNPNEEATRAWIAKILVTAIQKHGSIPSSINSLSFKDSEKIPSWARDEINIATNSKIITGYTDGTFKPDRTVSRAEMTALLSKSEEFISTSYLKNVVRGKIEVKQNDSLILDLGNNELSKILTNDSAIFYQDNTLISYSQLRTSDEISVVVNDKNEILYLDLLSTSERKLNEVEGKVYLNDVNKKLLTIEDDNQNLHSYKFSTETIVIKNNNTINFNDIKIFDMVRLTIEENEIKIIDIVNAYEEQREAEIISINKAEKIITAKRSDATFEVIALGSNIKIFDQQGGTISLDQLSVGDKIFLIYHQEKVASIEIPITYLDGYEVSRVRNGILTLLKNGISEEYKYNSNLEVLIEGYLEPSIKDVEIGDKVKATINQDTVTVLELQNRERKVFALDSVDTSAKALRVRDINAAQIRYINYLNTVTVYRDYSYLDSISKVNSNERVVLSLIDGQAFRVDVAVQQYYTITEIDQKSNSIRLRDSNNNTSLYRYTDQTIIRVNNTSSYMSNFSENDRVSVHKIGNEILEISK